MRSAALIVTADPAILEELLRIAAATEATVEVAHTVARARAAWRHPPLVLVGSDLAAELARAAVPRRPGVALVATEQGSAEVYRTAVEIGAQDVAVLPAAQAALADALASAADPGDDRVATVCVVGGRGGAGASTLAAALGVTGMWRGLRTLLVDADPLGGGLDLVLGAERTPGARWLQLLGRRGRLSSTALLESLPTLEDATTGGTLAVLATHRTTRGREREVDPASSARSAVVRMASVRMDGRADSGRAATDDRADLEPGTPVPATAMRTVLDAGRRGFGLIVVDLSRTVGPAGAEALLTADRTLLVVPAEVRAVVAASRIAATLRQHTPSVHVVVRGPAPGRLTTDAITQALELPLAGTLRNTPRLAVALEHGDLAAALRRGPLSDLCARLITELREAAGNAAERATDQPAELDHLGNAA